MTEETTTTKPPNNPTPEERAEYVVLMLEKFIRDGRKDEAGMSFRKWQTMAKSEIIIAIADAESRCEIQKENSKRVLFITSASLVTIGFWGTIINLEKLDYLIGAVIIGIAGVIGLTSFGGLHVRRWLTIRSAEKRRSTFMRINSLNRRIKRLERDLEIEAEELETLLAKALKLRG
ncbi:MAG: hypothetical protein CFH06_01469 [Alphaproteobacteria bacterium MarineAlpha3_Bin5]|nr:hypothetical protein [Magnetovibrio sp.]PPR77079.1 MAG: hypothetical protein CFH06_01469 [Alphaproteobacteria bacterium MarineAlpha3_Bin5]